MNIEKKKCVAIAKSKHLTKPITHIINLSFSTGIVPEQLKLAKVIPVFKKMTNKTPETIVQYPSLALSTKLWKKLCMPELCHSSTKTIYYINTNLASEKDTAQYKP